MKTKILLILGSFLWIFQSSVIAQTLVSLDPPFPGSNSPVTITFDASQGNGGLAGLPAGQKVYAHIGLTVNGNNWQYVVGNWGTADTRVEMTRVGDSDIYTLAIQPSIRAWFNENNNANSTIPTAAVISRFCMVFRNATGSLEGKTSSNSDIFVDLPTTSFSAAITSHGQGSLLLPTTQNITFTGQSSGPAILEFTLDGNSVLSDAGTTILNYTLDPATLNDAVHTLVFTANNGAQIVHDTIRFTPHFPVNIAPIPSFGREGIVYLNDSTAYLQLRAPGKQFVYVVGDFNDWSFDPAYRMNRTADGQFYWLQINGLLPATDYGFQYHIDWEGLRVTDAHVEKVLDPWNDQWIPESVYPNLPPYPEGKAEGIVGILRTTEHSEYQWDNSYTWVKPPKEDLIIYELHVRDFVNSRSYQEVLDRLGYLKTLGVNAVQFMPVGEFEGNDSWGYNPSFFFALDKAYGTKDKFKELIDSCHKHGMAVIVDVVYNHAFGQNPMVQMYFDPNAGEFGQPTPDNPWLNPIATHPFSVGYDFNHEAPATRQFFKDVMEFWLTEYKLDGFRFDLSKGFTQVNTGSNVGAWNQYDQSRVNIIFDYVNHCRSVSDDPYMILEHLGNWDEEVVFANAGMMVWAKGSNQYYEAAMGWLNGNNQNLYHTTPNHRGWNNYGMVQYAESHDEERLMYKNLNFGNSSGGYNTRNLATALERMSLVACFLIPLPGPKMLWQFGEVGYDQSINRCPNGTINENCRTAAKPVMWYYYDNINRRKVYDTYRKLNYLKTTYPVFRDLGVGMDLGGYMKSLRFDSNNLDAIIIGNFDVVGGNINVNFTQTGKWFEYLTGDSINITNTNWTFNLAAGEYRVYLNQRVTPPANNYGGLPNNLEDIEGQAEILVFPNPTQNEVNVVLPLGGRSAVISLYDISGKQVYHRPNNGDELIRIETGNLPSGLYLCRVEQGGRVYTTKIVKQP